MPADLASLKRLLARTALRVRVQRGLEAACWVCATSAMAAGVWLLLAPAATWTVFLAAVLSTLSFVLAASRRLPERLVSAAIDRAGTLDGRVQAASEFMRLRAAERSAFVEAALRDACVGATRVQPAQAAPLHRPRGSWLALSAALLCAGISARSAARAPRHVPHGSSVGARAESRTARSDRLLPPDELAVRAENARALRALAPTGTSLREQLAAYLALLAQLEAGTLNQEAALQQALTLEAKLTADARAEHPSDAATMRTLAAEIGGAAPELARALGGGALREAAEQLRTLAKQLAEGKLDEQQRARLQAALQQARQRERERAADRERERALESLLAQKTEASEPSLLKRKNEHERELEKLRRKQAMRPRRQLEKLTRELARAAGALTNPAPHEAEDALEDAADALEHYEGEQRDEEALRELARELAQLREQLQHQALSEPNQPRAEQRPDEPAQGKRNQPPPPGPEVDRDAAKARRERQLRFDLSARGGGDEQADGGARGEMTSGGAAGAPQQQVLIEQLSQRRLVAVEVPSESAGSEHDTQKLDTPTRSPGRYEDRALSGVTGPGPSRSQVIRIAAQSGFVSAPYRKVYGDYRAHEEAWLEQDDVPAGYRFHVRRYFELVRPRRGEEGRR
jgi:hypothetical protein